MRAGGETASYIRQENYNTGVWMREIVPATRRFLGGLRHKVHPNAAAFSGIDAFRVSIQTNENIFNVSPNDRPGRPTLYSLSSSAFIRKGSFALTDLGL